MGQNFKLLKWTVTKRSRRNKGDSTTTHAEHTKAARCTSAELGALQTREGVIGWQKLTSYLPHEKYCYG